MRHDTNRNHNYTLLFFTYIYTNTRRVLELTSKIISATTFGKVC